MIIVEIAALDNGAHNNQTYHGILPDGWAFVPDEMEVPATFPFVNITVDGDIVTSMTDGVVPDPEPVPDSEPAAEDILAVLLGVDE